ncbi:beta-adaptin-like protein A [Coccomyxa sp. Obi]|nr:beta-adaptin-like protein A [Coccomyxa sp. Obi]
MGESKSRGELAEIRTTLASLASTSGSSKGETAVTAKRDVFKKIINYITIGIDMSSLFMQVMTCAVSSGEDVVLKKMLYLYICTYAQSNPDLTLLTINLLTKDCKDQDPTIRGLALRSLCQLRVANLIEYIMSPIQLGLQDAHPYVRRTAVMGVLKVYHLDKAAVLNAGMLETLQEMMVQDKDAQVVANCMSVLKQAGAAQRLVSRSLVIPLLNRIKEFSEWAQCQVLEAVSAYRPSNEQEVFDIMNVLDDRLLHSNSAVVMATVKLFLHLTLSMPPTHQQIYTTFFCRQNEPSYIKSLKLEILTAIADETNAYEIATELTEYVNDIDEQLAREAVKAVGRIAIEVQDVGGIIERLLGFLETGKSFVTAEAVIQIKDLLRRFPSFAEACLASVSSIAPEDAPYLLEPVGSSFADEAVPVRLALLAAVGKLFFKRPPECQRLLGTVLSAAMADANQDVHDRALLYYRLLQQSVQEAERVVGAPLPAISHFAEEQSAELRDRIFDEFNSLAVVLRAPSAIFIQETPISPTEDGMAPAASAETPRAAAGVDEGSALLSSHEQEEALIDTSTSNGNSPGASLLSTAPPAAAPASSVSALDDLLGLSGNNFTTPAPAPPPPAPTLSLDPRPTLTPAAFQASWGALQPALRFTHPLPPSALAAIEANNHQACPCISLDFCRKTGAAGIATMASGGVAPTFRFYMYAKPTGSSSMVLTEAIVDKSIGSASVTLKCADAAPVQPFAELFRRQLDAMAG